MKAVELVAGKECVLVEEVAGHRVRAVLQVVILRRGCDQQVQRVPGRGCVCGAGDTEGVVRVPGHGRAQARRTRVRSGRESDARGVPWLELPHEVRRDALRFRHQ